MVRCCVYVRVVLCTCVRCVFDAIRSKQRTRGPWGRHTWFRHICVAWVHGCMAYGMCVHVGCVIRGKPNISVHVVYVCYGPNQKQGRVCVSDCVTDQTGLKQECVSLTRVFDLEKKLSVRLICNFRV